jgi:argininosuccinate lyase
MQEDKQPAFDAIDTLADCLRAVDGMLLTLAFDTARMRAGASGGFMAATDLADYLAARGVPFREAHETVGRLVLECERAGKTLQDLNGEDLRGASPAFGDDALDAIDIDAAVARRVSRGGTGHEAVRVQMAEARASLAADVAWAETAGGR